MKALSVVMCRRRVHPQPCIGGPAWSKRLEASRNHNKEESPCWESLWASHRSRPLREMLLTRCSVGPSGLPRTHRVPGTPGGTTQGHSVFQCNTYQVQSHPGLSCETSAGRCHVGMTCPAHQPNNRVT